MKSLLAVVFALVVALGAVPAYANLVEVTTSVPLTDSNDAKQLAAALQAAVEEALHHAISFTPTLVALTTAQVIGERLYVRVLAADEAGEQVLSELTAEGEGSGEGQASPKEVDLRT